MGRRVLAVSGQLLEDILRAQLGTEVDGNEEGLPEQVEIIGARMLWNGVFEFKLTSPSYNGPAEGERIPWLQSKVRT